MRKVTIAALFISSVGIAVAWQTGLIERWADNSFGAIPACEESLKAQLKSPSSYRRVAASFYPGPEMTLDEYKNFELTQSCADSMFGMKNCFEANAYMKRGMHALALKDRGQQGLRGEKRRKAIDALWQEDYLALKKLWPEGSASVILEYDANNDFGSNIRAKHLCIFGRKTRDGFSKSDIYFPSEDVSAYYY